MEVAAERVAELMKLLANKHRLLVLCQLAEGEKSVGELARLLAVREPAMSQQLSVLRREGLVRPRRDAQTIYYSVCMDNPFARMLVRLFGEQEADRVTLNLKEISS